jgi:hypothetical protein
MPVAIITFIGVTAFVVGPVAVLAPFNMQLVIRTRIACSAVSNDRRSIEPPRIGIVEAIIVVPVTVTALPEALAVPSAFIPPRSAFLTVCTPVSPVGTAFCPPCPAFGTVAAIGTALFSVYPFFSPPF